MTFRIPRLTTWLLTTAIVAAPMIFAAPLSAQEAEAAPPVEISLPAISVTAATRTKLQDRVLASGLVGAEERVLVQPQIEGQAIEEIHVEIGDTVAKGQVLAELSNLALTLQKVQNEASRASAEASIAQADASLIEAQANADEAVRVRDRTAALRAQGSASQAAADQANAAAASALARVTVAKQGQAAANAQLALSDAQIANTELQLNRTLVSAPVAGEVVERNAMIGAIATAGSNAMFVIVRDGLLELKADVAEQDVLRLEAGQTVTMTAVGLTEPLTGKVRLVEPAVDAATRLGKVRIAIDDSSKVRSGMFAQAVVLVQERDTLALPVTSVSETGTTSEVLKVGPDGVVAKVEVVTGIRDGGMIEVTQGLAEGDIVVARAGAFVRPGDKINPVPADAAEPAVN